MGVRMITESNAHRMKRPAGGLSNFSRKFLCDGDNAEGSPGCQDNLDGLTIWFDGTGLHRLGLNLGVTFVNEGSSDVLLYGSQMPKNYAELVNDDAGLPAAVDGNWIALGSAISTGEKYDTGSSQYSLYKMVFSGDGAISCMTL